MQSSGRDDLGATLAAVDRRLAIRRAAVAAVIAAVIAAGPALWIGGVAGAVAAGGAVVVAVVVTRRPSRAASWLDRVDRDDLVMTGAAISAGRIAETVLSPVVLERAVGRAAAARRPGLVAPVVGMIVAVGLIAGVAVVDRGAPSPSPSPSSMASTTSAGGDVGTGTGRHSMENVTDSAPGTTSVFTAPSAGASPALAAVPPRYQEIVSAYLARPR